ncbi:phage antirepressor KilAC domain-containing protein [Salinicoccus sp. Marseille-QA3877]
MNRLQVLEQRNVLDQELRIYGTQEEPLFMAKDIANWIDHSNVSKMVSDADLEENEKQIHRVSTLTNSYSALFLTEDGMYEVLMQSRKPIAKTFKKRIKEILKDIRKHGMYATPQTVETMLNNPDTMIELLQNYKEVKEKHAAAEMQIAKDKPKVLFAEAVDASESSILVGELAKLIAQNGYKIGQNQLFDWLRENGYLIKRKGESYNLPTQRSMDLEIMDIKKRVHNNPDGSIRTTRTTKITGKGQQYFINKFLGGNV